MPANKNAFTRYAILDNLLSDKHKNYSIQDMTDYIEKNFPESSVTRRQVEKDLNYLENGSLFDFEIERYKVDSPTSTGDGVYKKTCLRYKDPEFSIFKKPLTDDELSVLTSVLSTLGSFSGLPNFEWLDSLAQKLKIEERTEPEILSMSKNIEDYSNLLATLFGYISSKSAVKIEYKKFGSDEILSFEVSPYQLKEYNRRWYLIASPCGSDEILNFALDRINSKPTNAIHQYEKAPDDFIEMYEDIIGVTYYKNKPIEHIIFWVSAESKDYVDKKPLHGSMHILKGSKAEELQNKYPSLPNDGMFCSIDCIENYELIRELTTFGANLRVLEPTHIAKKVVGIAEEMVKAYKPILDSEQ